MISRSCLAVQTGIQERKDTITERQKWVWKEGREVKSKCNVERHIWWRSIWAVFCKLTYFIRYLMLPNFLTIVPHLTYEMDRNTHIYFSCIKSTQANSDGLSYCYTLPCIPSHLNFHSVRKQKVQIRLSGLCLLLLTVNLYICLYFYLLKMLLNWNIFETDFFR